MIKIFSKNAPSISLCAGIIFSQLISIGHCGQQCPANSIIQIIDCYLLLGKGVSWVEARARCAYIKATLTMITDATYHDAFAFQLYAKGISSAPIGAINWPSGSMYYTVDFGLSMGGFSWAWNPSPQYDNEPSSLFLEAAIPGSRPTCNIKPSAGLTNAVCEVSHFGATTLPCATMSTYAHVDSSDVYYLSTANTNFRKTLYGRQYEKVVEESLGYTYLIYLENVTVPIYHMQYTATTGLTDVVLVGDALMKQLFTTPGYILLGILGYGFPFYASDAYAVHYFLGVRNGKIIGGVMTRDRNFAPLAGTQTVFTYSTTLYFPTTQSVPTKCNVLKPSATTTTASTLAAPPIVTSTPALAPSTGKFTTIATLQVTEQNTPAPTQKAPTVATNGPIPPTAQATLGAAQPLPTTTQAAPGPLSRVFSPAGPLPLGTTQASVPMTAASGQFPSPFSPSGSVSPNDHAALETTELQTALVLESSGQALPNDQTTPEATQPPVPPSVFTQIPELQPNAPAVPTNGKPPASIATDARSLRESIAPSNVPSSPADDLPANTVSASIADDSASFINAIAVSSSGHAPGFTLGLQERTAASLSETRSSGPETGNAENNVITLLGLAGATKSNDIPIQHSTTAAFTSNLDGSLVTTNGNQVSPNIYGNALPRALPLKQGQPTPSTSSSFSLGPGSTIASPSNNDITLEPVARVSAADASPKPSEPMSPKITDGNNFISALLAESQGDDLSFDALFAQSSAIFLAQANLPPDSADAVEDTIVSCTFNQIRCDWDNDFTWVQDLNVGPCYTFHDKSIGQGNRSMQLPGPNHGLTMILNLAEPMSHCLESGGIKLTLHSPTEAPFIDSVSINISPGTMTMLALEKTLIDKNQVPEQCRATVDKQEYYYNESYTTEGCVRSCLQDAIINELGCYDPHIGTHPTAEMCPEQFALCLIQLNKKLGSLLENVTCNCPPPCLAYQYHVTKTSSTLIYNSVMKNICRLLVKTEQDCLYYMKKRIAIVKIYYTRFSHQVLNESYIYPCLSLMLDMSNVAGLVFGMSIIVFVEIIIGFFIIVLADYLCCNKSKIAPTTEQML